MQIMIYISEAIFYKTTYMKRFYLLLIVPFLIQESDSQTPNWAEDVSCLLYTHCTNCHNPNGVGPFSLLDYTDAYNNRFTIQYNVNEGIMPPWPPDHNYVSFAHEKVLTTDEIQVINDWVNAGAPQGDPNLAPLQPTYNSTEVIENPDWVAQIPAYTSQASSSDDYRCFAIENPGTSDKYITSWEVVPGNVEIVHHVLIFKDSGSGPSNNDNGDGYPCFGGTGSPTSVYIGGWAPGQGSIHYPDGMGVKLAPGETIVLQVHYPTGSAGQIDDATKVNFEFSDVAVREVSSEFILNHFTTLTNGPLYIPANTTRTFYSEYTLPADLTFLSVFPHMHLIGRSIKAYAVTPGGTTIPLIDIPEWDFEWQGNYDFRQPLYLPAGTTLYGEAFYDNTTNNPYNPSNPPINVSAGEATNDEMMLIAFAYLPYQNGDENIVVDTSTTTINYCDTLTVPENNNLYVDHTATGMNDGSSWADAFTDLQAAMAVGLGKTIHIAEGIYYPTSGTSRGAEFKIPSDATVLGGYSSGGGTRDPELYVTELSGDIDGIAGFEGNSFHVVKLANVSNVIVDGLTIRDGAATNTSSFARARGGGVYCIGSTVTFNDVKFRWNKAIYGGACFATLSPNVTFESCDFKNNIGDYASCLYHSNETNMYILNTRVVGNNALVRCSMEANNSLYTRIENSVFADNSSQLSNGLAFIATTRDASADIYNTTILGETKDKYLLTAQIGFGDQLDINIYNSIIAHLNPTFNKQFLAHNNNIYNLNTYNCYIQGSSVMGNPSGNLYEDMAGPLVLNADFSLDPCSPGINAGNNTYVPMATDIDGNTRMVGTVDIGAYEAQTGCGGMKQMATKGYFIFPNPTDGELRVNSNSNKIIVTIFDAQGKRKFMSQEKELDISMLSPGLYFVRIEDENGILGTEKIVKK